METKKVVRKRLLKKKKRLWKEKRKDSFNVKQRYIDWSKLTRRKN